MIISNYDIGAEIGSGAFSTVNIAEDHRTGTKVAVKCISKSRIQRSNMGSQVKKEITTMKKLQHPNIVQIKEVLMSNSHLFLVLEYASGGELFTKIARQGKLSDQVARKYFQQIMEAVAFCHNLYVCHRDIKPENILLDDDDNVKIADFGFAAIMEPEAELGDDEVEDRPRLRSIDEVMQITGPVEPLRDFVPDDTSTPKIHKFPNLQSKRMQKMSTMCGTTPYMAPEIVNRNSYRGDKADIWACGVVLFVLLVGYLPFDSHSTEIVIQKIQKGLFEIPRFVSDLARDVIERILTPNPLLRPGAKTILTYDWLSSSATPPLPNPSSKKQIPTINSKLPPTPQNAKIASKEERSTVLKVDIEMATSIVTGALKTNSWMNKIHREKALTTIKGSKMTSTGLAMIQIVLEKKRPALTSVQIDVFGRNQNAGAREINKLARDIQALG